MPLNRAIVDMLDAFAADSRPRIATCSPEQARLMMAAARAALGRGPELYGVAELSIETRAGSIGGRLFRPKERADGLLVYLHGGGWVLGTPEDFDAVARVLAAYSGCAVLLVDYRLAPEHPFPSGLEDCIDATIWAGALVEELAGQDVPIMIGGDSAGGNLAAVVAAELAGRVPLALQLLVYPVTDADFETASYLDPANSGIMDRDDMAWFFGHYAPDDLRHGPLVAPLRRGDLGGLPRAHVVTAEYDVLRDEGEAYADHLGRAGVPVTLVRYLGMAHGFVRWHNIMPEADEALREMAAVLTRACH